MAQTSFELLLSQSTVRLQSGMCDGNLGKASPVLVRQPFLYIVDR